jgi:hypothetical protein
MWKLLLGLLLFTAMAVYLVKGADGNIDKGAASHASAPAMQAASAPAR